MRGLFCAVCVVASLLPSPANAQWQVNMPKVNVNPGKIWNQTRDSVTKPLRDAGGQLSQASKDTQRDLAPTVSQAKIRVKIGAGHAGDMAGRGLYQIDGARNAVMTDPHMIDMGMTAAGTYIGGPSGGMAAHQMAGPFSQGLNHPYQHKADYVPTQQDLGGGGIPYNSFHSQPSGGSPGGVDMTPEQAMQYQKNEHDNEMAYLNKQQEMDNQNRPLEEQRMKANRDLQQTQQIIQGVGGILQILSQ